MTRWAVAGFVAIALAPACGSGNAPSPPPPSEGSTGGAGGNGVGGNGASGANGAGGSGGAGGAAGSTAQAPQGDCRPNPPAVSSWSVVTGHTALYPAVSAGADDAVFISDVILVDFRAHVRLWNGSTLSDDLAVVTSQLWDVWAASPSDVWAVGAGAWHRDAAGWTKVTTPSIITDFDPLKALWRLAPNDVIAVSDADVLRWDGSAWSVLSNAPPVTQQSPPINVNGIYAVSDKDIWAVGVFNLSGNRAGLEHWDGTAWTLYGRQADGWAPGPSVTYAIGPFTGIWGTSANDIWAVGPSAPGGLIHYDGTRWRDVALPNLPDDVTLTDVWSACPSDVWVSGWSLPRGNGYLFHFDGQTWSPDPAPVDRLIAITGSASTVWLVGEKALYARPR